MNIFRGGKLQKPDADTLSVKKMSAESDHIFASEFLPTIIPYLFFIL